MSWRLPSVVVGPTGYRTSIQSRPECGGKRAVSARLSLGARGAHPSKWNAYGNRSETWVRSFNLSQSPSGNELALFERPERSTTASFRRLILSASSGTRRPQAICASAQTSIAARGSYHDRDHRRALQFVFSG